MSSSSTTSFFSDLASLIYSTIILDHLKYTTNLELYLHKNLFCKFYYLQLISFFENTFFAQPHSNKLLDLIIDSTRRFRIC